MKKKCSRIRRGLFQVQWPDAGINAPRATVVGSGRVLIENYRSITEFTQTRVRLSVSGGEIIVDGQALSLSQARGSTMVVEGQIQAVTVPEGGRRDV